MKTQTQSNHHQRKPAIATPIGGVPAGFCHIDAACGLFASERAYLGVLITRLNDRVRDFTAAAMPDIRRQASSVATNHLQLLTLIDQNRRLFEKPRSRIFSDIKVGLQKQKGDTVIADKEKTLELIEKHFPDRLDELAPAERAISKKALANLTAAELKKIGVEIMADTDEVLIKPQGTDVEKAVAALLAEGSTTHQKAA